jgi:hypothetical protein
MLFALLTGSKEILFGMGQFFGKSGFSGLGRVLPLHKPKASVFTRYSFHRGSQLHVSRIGLRMVGWSRPQLTAGDSDVTSGQRAPISMFTFMHTKTIHRVMLVSISMLAICSRVSAQSCGGRPSGKDIAALRDAVAERVTEEHFWGWFGEESVPASRTEISIRVSANPNQDGGNVLVILPRLGVISLWRVCAQDFAFVYWNIYPNALMAIDSAKIGERFRQFSKGEAIKSVNLTIRVRETPDFGQGNTWKMGMLTKIQNALSCLLSHNEQIPAGQPLQVRVGDFTERSLKIPVEVVAPNQLWIVPLPLNSSGIVSAPVAGTIRPLEDASRVLLNRLQDHSFLTALYVTDEACGRLAGR